VQSFASDSSDPGHLSNNGYSNSYGYGLKLGYLGEIVPKLRFGAAYHSRTKMTKFSEYAGLFAEQGGMDIPSSWNMGLAYQLNPEITLVVDYQRINYGEINAVGNPMLPNLQSASLGNDNGAGFGWRDMSIYKLGVQWRYNEAWRFRAGYSNGTQPIPENEVLFNILAPAVTQQHVTIGFTRSFQNDQALNFALVRAIGQSVTGTSPMIPGRSVELSVDQWEADFSYSWKMPGS
jgi:long-chain fatty acid transport protein